MGAASGAGAWVAGALPDDAQAAENNTTETAPSEKRLCGLISPPLTGRHIVSVDRIRYYNDGPLWFFAPNSGQEAGPNSIVNQHT